MNMQDNCVCCGEYVPEGRAVLKTVGTEHFLKQVQFVICTKEKEDMICFPGMPFMN